MPFTPVGAAWTTAVYGRRTWIRRSGGAAPCAMPTTAWFPADPRERRGAPASPSPASSGGGLFPKANGGETCTARFDEAEYLGYALYGRDGRCRLRAHPKPVEAVRGRIGELAARGNAIPNGCRPRATTWSVRGRADYFRLADTRSLPQRTGKWMRRRVRKVCRKQRKRAHAAQDAQEMRN